MADDEQAAQDSTRSPDDAAVVWVDARHAVIVRWEDEPVVEWIESGVPRRRKARLSPLPASRSGEKPKWCDLTQSYSRPADA